jgi:hypothetical protein
VARNIEHRFQNIEKNELTKIDPLSKKSPKGDLGGYQLK